MNIIFYLQKFRETVKVILRTAKDNGVKSIAFPSLGVGNLHYPAQVSAKILFEELISFHAKNPGTDMKFFCVVFDQGIHKEFSKEYAKKMNTALPTKKVSQHVRIYPIITVCFFVHAGCKS